MQRGGGGGGGGGVMVTKWEPELRTSTTVDIVALQ